MASPTHPLHRDWFSTEKRFLSSPSQAKGFTLIELVSVLVVLAVLSLVLVPYFIHDSGIKNYAAMLRMKSVLSYAQSTALANDVPHGTTELRLERTEQGVIPSLFQSSTSAMQHFGGPFPNTMRINGRDIAREFKLVFHGAMANMPLSFTFSEDASQRLCFTSVGYIYETSEACR